MQGGKGFQIGNVERQSAIEKWLSHIKQTTAGKPRRAEGCLKFLQAQRGTFWHAE